MRPRFRFAAVLAAIALAATAASPAYASRHPVPRGGGGGAAHYGGAPRGAVPPRATAHGTAHYGYGGAYGYHGYPGGWWGYPYYGYGYPYYGWWGPGWSVGLSWGWGWPYSYGYYGPYYGPAYGPDYVITGAPSGPAVIETAVTPKSAEVLLDGTSIGYAKDYNGRWDELRVSPGHHTLELRDAGHRTLIVDLHAAPGATYRIDRELPAGSGEDRVTVGRPKPSAAAAAPEDGTAEPPALSGVARGLLRVHATPADAGVYLDGEFLGIASELDRLHGAIPVATGSHRLEVVRPGYTGQVKTVDVGADAPASIEITLSKD